MAWIIITALVFTPMADTGNGLGRALPKHEAETQTVSVNDNTESLFVMIVEAEAHPAWDLEGYMLLAQMVKNQLETGRYGNTYREVLTYKNNYTVYSNGRYKQVKITQNAREAVSRVLNGSDWMDYGQLYCCTESYLKKHPDGLHGRSEKVVQYDNVLFFK